LKEEQDVIRGEAAPGQHLYGEEIRAGKDRHMRRDEILPAGALGPFRCGREAVSLQDISDRLVRDVMAQVGQRTCDAIVTPTGVLFAPFGR
jgi:hypothetical protein